MKLTHLPAFILLFLLPGMANADPVDNIAGLLRQNSIQDLSKLFAASVEVALPDEEAVYSKAQAAVVLQKFFDQNKSSGVKLLHKINSNPNYLFGVLLVTTDKGVYRIAVTLNKTDGSMKIIEIRIEAEKAKP